ncbi:MAG: SRPBCC family protein, partial [Ilumatobacteraceae bacterium]
AIGGVRRSAQPGDRRSQAIGAVRRSAGSGDRHSQAIGAARRSARSGDHAIGAAHRGTAEGKDMGTMIEAASSVEVDCSASDAFAFVADAANNPRWQQGMKSCEWTTEPPIRVGSVYQQEASFLGKPITSTFEVVALDPGSSITIRTIESTFPIEVTRSVESIDEARARVSAVVRGDASGVFRIASPLLSRMVQRSVRGDYERLRELCAGNWSPSN